MSSKKKDEPRTKYKTEMNGIDVMSETMSNVNAFNEIDNLKSFSHHPT